MTYRDDWVCTTGVTGAAGFFFAARSPRNSTEVKLNRLKTIDNTTGPSKPQLKPPSTSRLSSFTPNRPSTNRDVAANNT
ncbi:hypothetical protein D3C77_720240 [compost metagenome]